MVWCVVSSYVEIQQQQLQCVQRQLVKPPRLRCSGQPAMAVPDCPVVLQVSTILLICLFDWLIDWLIVLWFCVPLDTQWVISETFPLANLLAWCGGKKTKPNTTKARIYQSKQIYCNTK